MARAKDYNIAELGPGDLYNHLPYVVRASDPGAIAAYWGVMASNHNRLAALLRALPRLQDPTQAAAFSPAALGEDAAAAAEYAALRTRWATLTKDERAYAAELEARVPASARALRLETSALGLLARTVGERTYSRLPSAVQRRVIATAISRHSIKGSAHSFHLLGRVTGYVTIKVTGLWSRYAIKAPGSPGSAINNGDFAYAPDHRPYWPGGAVYDGVLTRAVRRADGAGAEYLADEAYQVPDGTRFYDPFDVGDGGLTFEAIFPDLVPTLGHPGHYNAAINGHNPFGRFLADVDAYLLPGTYVMSGGSTTAMARVDIPSSGSVLDGCEVVAGGAGPFPFEALASGGWANGVTISAGLVTRGRQTVTITGPQSSIKFKSSHFDMTLGVDLVVFAGLRSPIPVQAVPDATPWDDLLGRALPGFPVTGSLAGSRILSDPSTHFAMDMSAHRELIRSVLELAEDLRPITRTPRRVLDGFAVSGSVRYAPVVTVSDVTLVSSSGAAYAMSISADGAVSWVPAPGSDHVDVLQADATTGRVVRWGITGAGVFSTSPAASYEGVPHGTTLVYHRGPLFSGHVYVDSGVLLASKAPPPSSVGSIHTDGTGDESIISQEYALVVENPPAAVAPFMSEDAVSDDAPSEFFAFQPGPEDDLTNRLTTLDEAGFYLESPWPEHAKRGADWGGFAGEDPRFRFAGPEPGVVEPVPSGTALYGDGLQYGHPVGFLDYHGRYVWRDRVSNAAMVSEYSYDSPGAGVGGTLFTSALEGDGPIEGTMLVSVGGEEIDGDRGFGPTPNGQVFGPERPDEWRRDIFRDYYPVAAFSSALPAPSGVEIDVSIPAGAVVRVSGSDMDGAHTVLSSTASSSVLGTSFGGPSGGTLAMRVLDLPVWGPEDIRVTISPSSGEASYALIGSGGETLASGTSDDETVLEVSAAEGRLYVEVGGTGGGVVRAERLSAPDSGSPGYGMWSSARCALEVTLMDPDDAHRFHDYDEAGIDPLDPIGSNRWHRGGAWRGSLTYGYLARAAPLPDVLVVTAAPLDPLSTSSSSSSHSSSSSSSHSSSSQSSSSSSSPSSSSSSSPSSQSSSSDSSSSQSSSSSSSPSSLSSSSSPTSSSSSTSANSSSSSSSQSQLSSSSHSSSSHSSSSSSSSPSSSSSSTSANSSSSSPSSSSSSSSPSSSSSSTSANSSSSSSSSSSSPSSSSSSTSANSSSSSSSTSANSSSSSSSPSSSSSSNSLPTSSSSSSSSSSTSGSAYDPMSEAYFAAIDAFSPTFDTSAREAFDAEVVAMRSAGLLDYLVEVCFFGLQDLDAARVNFVDPSESISYVTGGGAPTVAAGGISVSSGTYAVSNYAMNAVAGAGNSIFMAVYGQTHRDFGSLQGTAMGIVGTTSCSLYDYTSTASTGQPIINTAIDVVSRSGLLMTCQTSDLSGERSFIKSKDSTSTDIATTDFSGSVTANTRVFYIHALNLNGSSVVEHRQGQHGGFALASGPMTQAEAEALGDHLYAMFLATGAVEY